MTVFDDLAVEQDRLDHILSGLDEAQWTSHSQAAGWTIADVVLHLAQSEESVVVTMSGRRPPARPGRFQADRDRAVRGHGPSAAAHLRAVGSAA